MQKMQNKAEGREEKVARKGTKAKRTQRATKKKKKKKNQLLVAKTLRSENLKPQQGGKKSSELDFRLESVLNHFLKAERSGFDVKCRVFFVNGGCTLAAPGAAGMNHSASVMMSLNEIGFFFFINERPAARNKLL